MQYFVSIENTSYFYWQIELLIESFKMLNLDGDLVIGIAQEVNPKLSKYTRNIVGHKLRFMHYNYGNEIKYKPGNKPYAITLALENKILKSPFAVIHPDMILTSPIQFNENQENILFHGGIDDPVVMEKIRPYLEEIAKANNIKPDAFPPRFPLGGVMVFKDVPLEFFYRVMRRTEWLVKEHGPNVDWNLAKLAWTLTIYEHLDRYSCKGIALERRLIDHDINTNFVHYKHGLPPVFNKKFYMTESLKLNSDPYAVLMQSNPTTSTDAVQKVIRSYLHI